MDLIEVLKALSHENRIRIINLLGQQELCVCELENIMNVNQSNVSRHLRKLKLVDLIEDEQKAQWIYYSINKKIFNKHNFLKKLLSNELDQLSICQKDNRRLKKYQSSGMTCKELRHVEDLFQGGRERND